VAPSTCGKSYAREILTSGEAAGSRGNRDTGPGRCEPRAGWQISARSIPELAKRLPWPRSEILLGHLLLAGPVGLAGDGAAGPGEECAVRLADHVSQPRIEEVA